MQWDSLQLLEFVAMNHDHKNAALSTEEITDRYARDITPEGARELICQNCWQLLMHPTKKMKLTPVMTERQNDRDSTYYGDVESSLHSLCHSELSICTVLKDELQRQ